MGRRGVGPVGGDNTAADSLVSVTLGSGLDSFVSQKAFDLESRVTTCRSLSTYKLKPADQTTSLEVKRVFTTNKQLNKWDGCPAARLVCSGLRLE